MRRSEVILGAVFLTALTVASIVQSTNGTHAPVRPAITYASDDVRGGGYAAFARLLAREGERVEVFEQRPAELDDALDTLVVAYVPSDLPFAPPGTRTASDVDDLRAWVARGGHAIVVGADGRYAPHERAVASRPPVVEAQRTGPPYAGPLAAAVATIDPPGPLRFAPLAAGAHVLLADRGGALIVDVPIGRGDMRYVADGAFLTNAAIGHADNARLAYALARPRRAGGRIAFDEGLHGDLIDPSWWSIMPVWLRVALAGWTLTVLIALAGGALRLGPPVPAVVREPTSAAFLDAVTALYERAGVKADTI